MCNMIASILHNIKSLFSWIGFPRDYYSFSVIFLHNNCSEQSFTQIDKNLKFQHRLKQLRVHLKLNVQKNVIMQLSNLSLLISLRKTLIKQKLETEKLGND